MVDTAQFAGDQPDSPMQGRTSVRKRCGQLWKSLTVQSNGEIVACCYDVNGTMSYGNVNDISLREAWRGAAIRDLRKQHLDRDFSRLPLCDGCIKTFQKPKPAREPV